MEVWNVSQADGSLVGSDTLFTIPIASITLPSPEMPQTPVDIKAKLTTSAHGTRLFVSCQNPDTIVPIDYNAGSGSGALDSLMLKAVLSTDAAPITNAATPPFVDACGQTGSSCPQGLDDRAFTITTN